MRPANPGAPLPAWFLPPAGGWRADDLDRLPASAPERVELIDGALTVMAPHRSFHSRVILRLGAVLDAAAPAGIGVEPEMAVRLGPRQRPMPDLLAFRESALRPERTSCEAEDVLLVVEVVSPESEERDRETKPVKYAKAGIAHMWLVEEDDGAPVVHVYELDRTTGSYLPTQIARDRLTLSAPFPLDIDVRALYG